ncbi:hypothetical protein [Cyanothece sp. BG0011]|uniref:hypothetical protein n=1 Tax=Cyanothece sp. BG0011 TaxID=2082950 RepID=UPI000D1FCBFC|nr:hypothetical protein [Cyanothece sp. BG0011]
MYCLTFKIRPTAAMTFRILPGSILNIATYPFVPPTTLSGFLRRLAMLSHGLDLPETTINKNKPPYYTLPRHCVTLGAYPVNKAYRGVHRTYRKGMRSFNHDTFSRLYVEKGENFQLHTWEYFITDELVGYVVSESQSSLESLSNLESFGCKLGKEGFAVIEEVSSIIKLQREKISAHPSTIVPMEALLKENNFVNGCDIYNLYRYDWSINEQIDNGIGLLDQERSRFACATASPINGFIPFVAAYYPKESEPLPTLEFYTDGIINIPTSLVNLLSGEKVNA